MKHAIGHTDVYVLFYTIVQYTFLILNLD